MPFIQGDHLHSANSLIPCLVFPFWRTSSTLHSWDQCIQPLHRKLNILSGHGMLQTYCKKSSTAYTKWTLHFARKSSSTSFLRSFLSSI